MGQAGRHLLVSSWPCCCCCQPVRTQPISHPGIRTLQLPPCCLTAHPPTHPTPPHLLLPAVVSIGGIKAGNAGQTVAAGCAGAAVVSGIFGADSPAEASQELLLAVDAALRERGQQ